MGGDKAVHVLIIGNSLLASYSIGIRQPFQNLENTGKYQFETKFEWEVNKDTVKQADIVIFFRTIKQKAYECLEWAREMGKRTVYVIDDHFLAMPPVTGLGKRYADPDYRILFAKFLINSQIIKVDSLFFAHHIRTHFNANTVYFPASVDFSMIDKLKKPERKDGKIVIGYEGGEKEEAFNPVVPALLKIIEKYGSKIKLEFIGYIPTDFIGHRSASYEEGNPSYRRFLREFCQCTWDIGLAPLENTLFDDCKTNNKFREYAACQIAGIYSSTPAYMEGVVHGESGMFAQNSVKSWYSAIETLIEQPQLRQYIKDNAYHYARKHFNVENCAENWSKHILHR